MKKVLQINVSNSGSTGRISEEIGRVWMNNGYESFVAYGRIRSDSSSKLIQIGSAFDKSLHGLKTRLFDLHAFGSVNATNKLVKLIKEIQPDVILLHNLHGYYVNIEVLFAYLKSINTPVIWTLFDCWAFTGHCTYFDSVDCPKWKTQCFECPLTNEYPTSWYVDNSLDNYSRKKQIFNSVKNMRLVTHSQWLAQLVSASFLKGYPIHKIANGLNLSVFKPTISTATKKKYNLPDNYILGVANIWNKRKGLLDFSELSKLIDDQTKIVLVGLNAREKEKLPSNIIAIPHTDSTEELAELYTNAFVFINPTHEDNFPTVNIEALACGTPVVTYDTGGSPEAIDEQTGFVVKKGDISGLAEAVSNIQTYGRAHYTELCRQRAIAYFNCEHRYQEYISLYNEITAEIDSI
jgi:putative colanic acid biosynthesis glycosyltransferase